MRRTPGGRWLPPPPLPRQPPEQPPRQLRRALVSRSWRTATPVPTPAEGGTAAAGAATEAEELEAQAAAAVAAAAELLAGVAAAAAAAAPVAPAAPAAPQHAKTTASPARVIQLTPSAALRRPGRSPVPPAAAALGKVLPGTRAFTATNQARLAESLMRKHNSARRLTAKLTCLYVQYKNALRAALPAGVTRPGEVADLGQSAVARIRSTLAAQTDLARAILADVERFAAKSSSSRAMYGRLSEEVRDQAICNAIASGEVKLEPA